MTIVNAEITGTYLGIEGHGILTAFLHCEFDDYAQSFGGYALDTYDAEKKRRVGHSVGSEFINRVLETAGVENWEKLKGKHIRVDREKGWNGKIVGIGHITKNKWFYPERLVEEMKA